MKAANVCEDSRADQPGDTGQAGNRALQLSLFGGTHAARHKHLRGRSGEAPKRHDRNAQAIEDRRGGKAIDGKARRPAKRPVSMVRRSPSRAVIGFTSAP